MLRSPVNLKFYEKPIRVAIQLNNNNLGSFVLPRNNSEWLTKSFTAYGGSRGKDGLLTVTVNKLSTIRIKNSVKRIKVGVDLAVDL